MTDGVTSEGDPQAAMNAHWQRTRLTPTDAVTVLAPACGGQRPSAERLAAMEREWRNKPDAYSIVLDILWECGERITGADCKTVYSPACHDELVQDLASATHGVFAVENVAQTYESPDDDELHVRFMHGGISHGFGVENWGRYYNVPAVLVGLNGVLEALGRPERFFEVHCEGVAAIIVFVHGAPFLSAVERLHIPLAKYSSM